MAAESVQLTGVLIMAASVSVSVYASSAKTHPWLGPSEASPAAASILAAFPTSSFAAAAARAVSLSGCFEALPDAARRARDSSSRWRRSWYSSGLPSCGSEVERASTREGRGGGRGEREGGHGAASPLRARNAQPREQPHREATGSGKARGSAAGRAPCAPSTAKRRLRRA